jgi:uncharacterized protein YdcH (DUF465 family)
MIKIVDMHFTKAFDSHDILEDRLKKLAMDCKKLENTY